MAAEEGVVVFYCTVVVRDAQLTNQANYRLSDNSPNRNYTILLLCH